MIGLSAPEVIIVLVIGPSLAGLAGALIELLVTAARRVEIRGYARPQASEIYRRSAVLHLDAYGTRTASTPREADGPGTSRPNGDASRTLEEASEMTDSTAEFFHELDRRGHEPLLEKATGSVRFDLADGRRIDRWLVSLDRGEVTASRKNAPADCIVRTDRRLFDAIARGDVNAMAAYLRGDLTLEGDPELMVLIQRIFPGPPAASRRRGARRGGDQE